MRKLSEIRGEDALDVLADTLEQFAVILSDQEFVKVARGDGRRVDVVKYLLKEHKKEVMTIMAILDGEDPDTYSPSIIEIPIKLLEIINDEDLKLLFPYLGQVTSSGPVMESIEATEQE